MKTSKETQDTSKARASVVQASEPARLEALFRSTLRAALQKELGLDNVMAVPRLCEVVVNVGVGRDAVGDSRVLAPVEKTIATITGQAPVRTLARKSIAAFKLREGMPLAVMVTLRGRRMYDFLDKLINVALPRVRDFQGVGTRLDGRGNYNLGIKEWNIFPEADTVGTEKVYGFNITVHTTARNDREGFELMKSLGMPFKKK